MDWMVVIAYYFFRLNYKLHLLSLVKIQFSPLSFDRFDQFNHLSLVKVQFGSLSFDHFNLAL